MAANPAAAPRSRQSEAQQTVLRSRPLYEFRTLSAAFFQTALRQHRIYGEVHSRSLDRLDPAGMEELERTRLMPHDDRQAKTAHVVECEVVQPGRA